ncbi:MAG: hypothetical protein GY754_46500 [bacterium]|nr:hypothetical protein [bacterium]
MPVVKDYGESFANLSTAQDEYIFTRIASDGIEYTFVICDIYFHSALDSIPPNQTGWDGILLEYHCNLEWLDNPYILTEISDLVNILKKVKVSDIEQKPFGPEALKIIPELISFLSEAILNKQKVILSLN